MKNQTKNNKMPDVILDLTDMSKTIEEAFTECETKRQELLNMPWYKKLLTKCKRSEYKNWYKG